MRTITWTVSILSGVLLTLVVGVFGESPERIFSALPAIAGISFALQPRWPFKNWIRISFAALCFSIILLFISGGDNFFLSMLLPVIPIFITGLIIGKSTYLKIN